MDRTEEFREKLTDALDAIDELERENYRLRDGVANALKSLNRAAGRSAEAVHDALSLAQGHLKAAAEGPSATKEPK